MKIQTLAAKANGGLLLNFSISENMGDEQIYLTVTIKNQNGASLQMTREQFNEFASFIHQVWGQ